MPSGAGTDSSVQATWPLSELYKVRTNEPFGCVGEMRHRACVITKKPAGRKVRPAGDCPGAPELVSRMELDVSPADDALRNVLGQIAGHHDTELIGRPGLAVVFHRHGERARRRLGCRAAGATELDSLG